MASRKAIIPHGMQHQDDSQRNGVQPSDLHRDMADLGITTNGPGTPAGTALEYEATSVTEADTGNDGPALALDMQKRCRLLLDELEQFQAYLKKQGKENTAELRAFKTEVQSEMRLIDKVIYRAFRALLQLLIFLHSWQKTLSNPQVFSRYDPPILPSSPPFGPLQKIVHESLR